MPNFENNNSDALSRLEAMGAQAKAGTLKTEAPAAAQPEAAAPMAAEAPMAAQAVEAAGPESRDAAPARAEQAREGGVDRRNTPVAELARLRQEQAAVVVSKMKEGVLSRVSGLGSKLFSFGFKIVASAEKGAVVARDAVAEDIQNSKADLARAGANVRAGGEAAVQFGREQWQLAKEDAAAIAAAAMEAGIAARDKVVEVGTAAKDRVVEVGTAARDRAIEAGTAVAEGVRTGAELAVGLTVVAAEGAVRLGREGLEATQAAYNRAVEKATQGYENLTARGERALNSFRQKVAESRARLFGGLADIAIRGEGRALEKKAKAVEAILRAEDRLNRARGETLREAA